MLTLFVTVVAVVAAAGGVIAVASREPRAATVGLLVALLGSVFVADPLPPPGALAVRLVAGILAGYLLWVVVGAARISTSGSVLGWPVEAILALAGGLVGWASHGLGAPGRGPEAASALGVALVVLSAAPVVLGGRDVLRVGIGLTLLLSGAFAVRVGLAGTPGPAEQIVLAGLTAGLGAAVAILVRNAVGARDEGRGAGGGSHDATGREAVGG
ncbi:MAG TPA: hypothetical protein VNO86_08365 [Candidatus Binatia bacterium]|nr:hypothetical protein [Candidatus Binatia bacterium]